MPSSISRCAYLCALLFLSACSHPQRVNGTSPAPSTATVGSVKRYLSDEPEPPRNPYKLLYALQRQAYAKNPRLRPPTKAEFDLSGFHPPAADAQLNPTTGPHDATADIGMDKDVRAYFLAQLQQPLPTPLEHPSAYILLKGRFEQLRHFAQKVDHEAVIELPAFGTLPIPTVNAQAIRVPGSPNALVVVNGHLFMFVHEMTKVSLQTIQFGY